MPYSRSGFIMLMALLGASVLSENFTALSLPSITQERDKSLDIERYPEEPLELIELRIGDKPIKDKIATKWRHNGVGIDTVNFKEEDGWFKHLQVRLRNISGKTIHGVGAHLYFRPADRETLYSLPLAASTPLGQHILEPGADITLTVTEQAWSLTAIILKQYGVNPDLAPVSFGVDGVWFSNDLQWRKGMILRPDPGNPNIWKP